MFTAQVFHLPAKGSDFASAAGDTELEAVRAALKVEYPMYCRGEPEAVHVVDGMRTDDPHLRFVITTEPAPPSDLQPLLDRLDTEAAHGTLFGARVEEVDPGIPLAFITALPDPGWPDPSSPS